MIAGANRARGAALGSSGATSGDIDIMRFLAAAELLEADLWQQYSELATGNETYERRSRQLTTISLNTLRIIPMMS